MLLKHYLEQGMSKTAIAEQLGIARRTVDHWIKTGQLDRDVGFTPRVGQARENRWVMLVGNDTPESWARATEEAPNGEFLGFH